MFQAFRESSPGWSTLFSPVLLNADGSAFLVQTPIRDGDHGYFKYVKLSVAVARIAKQVTFLS